MTRKNIFTIYDKIFKKILTLSTRAIINLINGLFGTNFPLDSKITYNWTEFENDELKKILADTIITINGIYSYHVEAQMSKDDNIIFRVFEYGYAHASRSAAASENEIIFPEPMVIYLYYEGEAPDEYTLTLNFGTQGTFDYKVKVFKYLDVSTEELNNRKMVILIPFMLLKLRKLIKKERSAENLEKLKNLIQNDIIASIDDNLKVGNITYQDAQRLRRLTHMLYTHLYASYDELEVLNDMTDQSIILDIDDILDEFEEKLERKQKEYESLKKESESLKKESESLKKESESLKKETERMQRGFEEKLAVLTKVNEEHEAKLTSITEEKDNIIEGLKRQIEELKREANKDF